MIERPELEKDDADIIIPATYYKPPKRRRRVSIYALVAGCILLAVLITTIVMSMLA